MTDSMNRDGPPGSNGADPGEAAAQALHRQIIQSHYSRPRNRREIANATVNIQMENPACGDAVSLSLLIEGDRIADAGFIGQGCSISQSSASMLTVLLEGRTLTEAEALYAAFREMVQGGATAAQKRELGDLRALAGVARFPVRVRCAMLPWDALLEAIRTVRLVERPTGS